MKNSYRLGCVGLLCDLPIFVAHAKGMFEDQGLKISICAELGWAGIESELTAGRLDIANVPAVLPLASPASDGKIPLLRAHAATSFEGLSIALAPDAHARVAAGRPAGPIRIGVESPYSLCNYILQAWVKRLSLEMARQVVPVPVAVSQMLDLLKEGYVQGVCAAEPVVSAAAASGTALSVASSRDFYPRHPGTVISSTHNFASANPEAIAGIVQALRSARRYCSRSENHGEITNIFMEQKSSVLASHGINVDTVRHALEKISMFPSEDPAVSSATRHDRALNFLCLACQSLPGAQPSPAELRARAVAVFGQSMAGEPMGAH